MKPIAIAVFVLMVTVSAWAQTGITDVRMAFQKASNAGDVAALVALFTPDAVLMPPDMPMAKGKADIEAFYRKQFDMAKMSEMVITAMDTKISGNLAYEAGTYTQTITTKAGGKPFTDTGKYLVVLKRQGDGPWKLAYQAYSSDKPMPMPPPAQKKPAPTKGKSGM